jgi:hypothetical protein
MDLFGLGAGDWFVVRTRVRQERILAERLTRLGMAVYQPSLLAQREYAGYSAVVEVPMFPGHVFLRLTHHHAAAIPSSERILTIARAADGPPLAAELQAIERARSLGAPLRRAQMPRHMIPVEVACGRFQGLVGSIDPDPIDIAETCARKLYLPVSAIARAVAMPIEADLLVPAC